MKKFFVKLLFVIIVLLLTSKILLSQPITVWTVDGDSIPVFDVKFGDSLNDSTFYYLKGKRRWISLDKNEIFGVVYPEGKHTILYSPQNEYDMSISRMTMYIKGHSLGYRKSNKTAFFTAFGAGLISMSLPPDQLYLAPIFPISAIVVIGKVTPIKKPDFSNEDILDGYIQRRKKQNIKYALYGGMCGLLVGSLSSFAVYGWGWK
ncbi:MAG TPA: hypothetical protein PK990_04060 [Salinivirgaceae bacterium]|nr:hypothetical protein [Salinivirgaceae bacterium]